MRRMTLAIPYRYQYYIISNTLLAGLFLLEQINSSIGPFGKLAGFLGLSICAWTIISCSEVTVGSCSRYAHFDISNSSCKTIKKYHTLSASYIGNTQFLRSYYQGSGCSTAVEHTPRNREVVGSNPVGSWAFSSFLSSQ